ncbi:hypothetical protein BRC2024_KWYBBTRE_CDS_0067 [Acinetobacter phage vB_AbaM_AB-Navy-v2]
MDVLSTFKESKAAIDEIAKTLFDMFESNDIYKIISHSDISYLDFTEHRTDDNLVMVNLYNYSDINPRISFEADRAKILSCDESTIDMWHKASLDIIEAANTAKALKFLKDFTMTDHGLIHVIISNYEKLSEAGKTNQEIAEMSAKFISLAMAQKYKQLQK